MQAVREHYKFTKSYLVAHTLVGSIVQKNVGMTVNRSLRVKGDKLIITLDTTTQQGEPVTRTLRWKRIS